MPQDISSFPSLFESADRASLSGQRSVLVATGVRLGLAVVAAIFAGFAALHHDEGMDVLGLGAAVAFAGALVAEIWLLVKKPEHQWFDGRALAESAKTLAWRYAVGGLPYSIDIDDPDALLTQELTDLLTDSLETSGRLVPDSNNVVTASMASLRKLSLDERRQSYLESRIREQERWYSTKARRNDIRARRWKLCLIALEVLGVVAGTATGFGYLKLDVTSVVSTVLGASVAWLALKQHDALARAYGLAAHELGIVASLLKSATDEQSWATAVSDAEEAISREHTMWRAARIVVDPVRPTARS